MGLAALSIDLDALQHYYLIHGLERPAVMGGPAGPALVNPDPVYTKAVERFGELCGRLGLRGTVFCIGAELERVEAEQAVRGLAAAGHEIANHTYSHDYAITRRPQEAIAADVRAGGEAIARVAGRPPVGFRAPGYTLSAPLVDALAEQGYRYDSSPFPALPYYLCKAGVMAALALLGHPSRAILDRPRVLLAPRAPYRPRAGEPYARGSVALLELPVTTGLLGFPLIGTFVATLPAWALRVLRIGTGSLPLFNLELHGIDLLDASDATPRLAARQRDLRVPASTKIARIEAFVRELGREWVTLEEAAERFRRA